MQSKRVTLDQIQYLQCYQEYEQRWKALDNALYAICNQYPDHRDVGGVAAKVYLIGRAYSTQIERHVPSEGEQGKSMEKVIDHLYTNAGTVDGLISELDVLIEPLTPETLSRIVSVHGRFVRLLATITREGKLNITSFSSKYLHFHRPAVPIYDNVAVKNLGKLWKRTKCPSYFDTPVESDQKYVQYVNQMYGLYADALAIGLEPTVKLIDNYASSITKVDK